MAKFYGKIGFVENIETAPGVWSEVRTEQEYFGDVIKNSRRWQAGENLNDDLIISNEISIVADPYANQNFHSMKYIQWMGSFWKITKIDVQSPRLILSIGGVYNGSTGPTPSTT